MGTKVGDAGTLVGVDVLAGVGIRVGEGVIGVSVGVGVAIGGTGVGVGARSLIEQPARVYAAMASAEVDMACIPLVAKSLFVGAPQRLAFGSVIIVFSPLHVDRIMSKNRIMADKHSVLDVSLSYQ